MVTNGCPIGRAWANVRGLVGARVGVRDFSDDLNHLIGKFGKLLGKSLMAH